MTESESEMSSIPSQLRIQEIDKNIKVMKSSNLNVTLQVFQVFVAMEDFVKLVLASEFDPIEQPKLACLKDVLVHNFISKSIQVIDLEQIFSLQSFEKKNV